MIETELATRLALAGDLTALVADRIFPGRAPPNTVTPYVVWSRADTNPGDTFDKNKATHVAEIDVDCYGESYAAAKAVAEHVKAALDGWQGGPSKAVMSAALITAFDDFDAAAGAHRAALAFDVLYRK